MSAVIHRCSGCGHKDGDHGLAEGTRCSMGGCRCVLSQTTVAATEPAEEIPTWPGYDHTTGKWATR